MRVLGIDPGLQKCGWGVVESSGHSLSFVACGLIKTTVTDDLSARLAALYRGLAEVLEIHRPECASIEETFVNKNPASALKLGQARGVLMAVPAIMGLSVYEYGANKIKKSVVGSGHASKEQVMMMIRTLLPASGKISADEADALAAAITHTHYAGSLLKRA